MEKSAQAFDDKGVASAPLQKRVRNWLKGKALERRTFSEGFAKSGWRGTWLPVELNRKSQRHHISESKISQAETKWFGCKRLETGKLEAIADSVGTERKSFHYYR
jgi:hypothetical protein